MKVTRYQAVQVHPVPDKVQSPQGPFPRELFCESEIISDYEPSYAEDGGGFELGGTAQNNYRAPKVLRCASCFARVMENETADHVCEE
jgi:hypothetical protein